MNLVDELRSLFPGEHPLSPHDWVADFLEPGETVIWQGTRERGGEYSIVSQVVRLLLVVVVVVLVARFAGLSLAPLEAFLDGEVPAYLWIPVGVTALVVLVMLGMALRNPSDTWVYAITDKRLLTFYKGRNVRAALPADVERFAARRGIEGLITGIGSVTWRLGNELEMDNRGPDRGRHGFLHIKDPVQMRDSLKQWRAMVYEHADQSDTAFAAGVSAAEDERPEETAGAGPVPIAGESASEPAPAGTIRVQNRRFGFSLLVPEHWSGKMCIRRIEKLKILGIQTPIKAYAYDNETELPATSDDWNYLALEGSADVSFELEVLEGPIPTTYDAQMEEVKRRGEEKGLIQSDPSIDQPPFKGFSMAANLAPGGVGIDTGIVRRIWLGTPDYHLSIYAKVAHGDSGAQSEAMDAMVASIGPL